EAARLVLRHRALHGVEEILDVLAAPRGHERVERQRRDFHHRIAPEIGTMAALARASVGALAPRGLGIRVDAIPHRNPWSWILRKENAEVERRDRKDHGEEKPNWFLSSLNLVC